MSSFLEQELLGAGSRPTGDPRISQAVHSVAGRDRLLTDDEISERAQALSNDNVATQAQSVLSENPLDATEQLNALAAQYDAVPNAKRTLAAAEAALAVSEEPGRRTALAERANRIEVESNFNRQTTLLRLRDKLAQLEQERRDLSMPLDGGTVLTDLANQAGYVSRSIVEFVDSQMLPGFYAEVINIVKDVAPEVAGVVDYVHPEEARQALTRMVVDLPPEKSKEIVDAIFAAAHSRAGRLLGDNRLGEAHLLQEILEPLERLRDDSEGFGALSNWLAPLDALVGAGLIKGGLRAAKIGASVPEGIKALFAFPKGSVPWTVSNYEKGAESLVKAATTPNGAPLAEALGTSQTAIVGDLVLPKPAFVKVGEEVVGFRAVGDGKSVPVVKPRVRATGEAPATQPDLKLVGEEIVPKTRARVEGDGTLVPITQPTYLPHGKPWLDEFFLSAEDKLLKAAAVEQGLKDTFSLRLNDTVIEEVEKGLTAYMRIGNGRGTGWSLPQDAANWGKVNLNVPFSVEKDLAGTYQVTVKHFYAYGTDDVGKFIKPTTGVGIGRGSRFSEFIVRASQQAGFITTKAEKLNKEIVAAFTKLSKQDSLRVQETLLEGEELGKEFSRAELVAKALSPAEIEGYEAIRTLSGKVLRLKNEDAYNALRSSGFNKTLRVDGGEAIVKEVDPNQIGATKLLSNSIRSVNLVTGQPVKLANLDLSKHKLYRFFEDTKSGYTYGVTPIANTVTLYDLPVSVLKRVHGWMPRYYNAPYFVREVASDGRTIAFKTARSKKAAEAEIESLRTTDPDKTYRAFEASEISDDATSIADIAMLREQGLLYTSHRRPLALLDVEGGAATLSVPNAIERLVHSASLQEGIGRWTLAMKQAFDNTYSKTLGFTMDLARAPQRPLDVTKHKAFDEAMKVYDFVRRVNGLDASQGSGQYVRGMRNKVADLFYNFGYGRRGAHRQVSEWFGDNISGLNPTVLRNLKSAAFAAYIGLNPLVHAPLQMSMIPTYAGVKHALPYLAKGQFFNDSLILQFSNDVAKLDTLRKRLGLSNQYTEKLLTDYRNSGLQQMVDNHIAVAGTLGDSRVAMASRTRKGMAAVFNAAKSVGFDVGVSADKRAAWLIMRNRAIKDGKNLDATGLKAIAQDAEFLTGSLNQSDPLYNSDGLVSLFAQFLSHPIKMSNRLVGGFTGGRVGGEVGLSAAEQRRIALASLASYGFAGFGVTELVERLNTKHQWNLPDPVKEVLQEGMLGVAINSAIRLSDEQGERSKVMFSSRYSPFSQAGMLLTNGRELGILALELDFDQMIEFFPNPAAMGVVGSTLDVMQFYYHLAGGTDLPQDDIALATSAEFLKKFPLTNNLLKAHMAFNLGYKFDSRGKAIVEATKGEAIASAWGVKSYAEYAITRGNTELYGKYEPLSGEALSDRIKEAAQGTLQWLMPTLRSLGDGTISKEEASKLIESHNITFRTGLTESEYAEYRNVLAKEILRSDVIKSDRFLESLSKRITSGQVPASASLRDKLYGLEFPGKETIIPAIERMFNEVEVQ